MNTVEKMPEQTEQQIIEVKAPAGYMRNRKGHLVEETLIDPYDLEMDAFVKKHTQRAFEIQKTMREFKLAVYEDCLAFQELLAEKYEAKIGGSKGGVSFTSFDGQHQIRISVQDRTVLGPELKVAETLIKECANEWAEGASPELKIIVHTVFETDKEGNISTGKILKFRRDYKSASADIRWQNAMDAIGDAINVIGSKTYLNFKKRNGEGKYQDIPLSIAKL